MNGKREKLFFLSPAGSPVEEEHRKGLEELLQSVSDVLFPEDLGSKPVSIDSQDADGDTPLHILVGRGDREGVAILLNAGADVDAVGDMGETPLHIAVYLGDEAMVRILLEAGANPDICSEFGETAREKARRSAGKMQHVFENGSL